MIKKDIPFHSIKFIKETEDEFIYRCPFCSDSPNKSHGHFYISKRYPVYFCQRCSASGSIKTLEKELDERCNVEYNTSIEYNLPELSISKVLYEIRELIKYLYHDVSNKEKEYLQSRSKLKNITLSNILKFSIIPDSYCKLSLSQNDKYKKINFFNDELRLWTISGLGSILSGRTIENKTDMRYMTCTNNVPWKRFLSIDCYFIRSKVIQNFNSFNPPKYLIISEGIYDCINIYLNRSKYLLREEDSLYMAVQCNLYSRALSLYSLMYNFFPEEIIVFADMGIDMKMIYKQFNNAIKHKVKITVNYPMLKDWEPFSIIRSSKVL